MGKIWGESPMPDRDEAGKVRDTKLRVPIIQGRIDGAVDLLQQDRRRDERSERRRICGKSAEMERRQRTPIIEGTSKRSQKERGKQWKKRVNGVSVRSGNWFGEVNSNPEQAALENPGVVST